MSRRRDERPNPTLETIQKLAKALDVSLDELLINKIMQKEAKARIKINNLLQESGWRFFDDGKDKTNIVLENNAKLTKQTIDEFGNDFEKTKKGFIDFLLLDEKGFPFVVLEAKSEDKDPLDGKEQARRLIGGNSRAVFEYFVGYKLGLTATPKNYLKNIDPQKVSVKDPRAWERRQLLDTYTTFGCSSGEPTFRYSLLDGVKDGYLVNPIVADARTEITTELLSEKGYSLMVENEEGIEGVEEYVKTEIFEKPEDYFNLDKLRKSVKADRRITLKEFIEKIFGGINKFKSKDELLEDEFENFVSIYKPESKYALPIKNYLKAYITDSEIRDIVETKEYSRFATNPKVTMKDLRELNGYREVVPEYVKNYVSINAFM